MLRTRMNAGRADGRASAPERECKLGWAEGEPGEAEKREKEADAGADETHAESEHSGRGSASGVGQDRDGVPLPSRQGEPGVVFAGAFAGLEGCDGAVEAGKRVRGGGLGGLRVVGDAARPAELGEILAKGLLGRGHAMASQGGNPQWTASELGSLRTAVRFIHTSISPKVRSFSLREPWLMVWQVRAVSLCSLPDSTRTPPSSPRRFPSSSPETRRWRR